jgi:hypothetical protein
MDSVDSSVINNTMHFTWKNQVKSMLNFDS